MHPEDYLTALAVAREVCEKFPVLFGVATSQQISDAKLVRKLASIEGVRYKMRETQVALAQAGSSAGFNMDTIVEELASPRREWRQKALGRLSAVEIFNSITGESQRSLRVGVIVPVHVVNIHDNCVDIRLDCGLRGKLWSRNMQPRDAGAHYVEMSRANSPLNGFDAKVSVLNRRSFQC